MMSRDWHGQLSHSGGSFNEGATVRPKIRHSCSELALSRFWRYIPRIIKPTTTHKAIMPWLMKAEPDSRIVKGKDVKASTVMVDASAGFVLSVSSPLTTLRR